MAGAACKVIINNGLHALTTSLEQILTTLPQTQLPEEARKDLIQELADVDICSYNGDGAMPSGGLRGIMLKLQDLGILSDDIWEVYARGVISQSKTENRG